MSPLPIKDTQKTQIIIDLDLDNSSEARELKHLVQRRSYDQLRLQIVGHLTTLQAAKREYAPGSGWTYFLDGTRGAGKSTFLSSIKLALEHDHEIRGQLSFIAAIDPGRIERSEIILLVILQKLKKRVEHNLQNSTCMDADILRNEWRQIFRGVAGGLSLLSDSYHPLEDLDPELFLDWGLERTSDSTNLRSKLHSLFSMACRILQVKALMFAFDDADTDSTHAIKLLACIRKYLDTPIVMVIVTGDIELYSLLVRQHFSLTVTGKRDAALERRGNSEKKDRFDQYLQMIDHLEEQYLLKLFPIPKRMRLLPLANVIRTTECMVQYSKWERESTDIKSFIEDIVRFGLFVKTESDISLYTDFLLNQPLRSILQVSAHCAPYLNVLEPGSSSSLTNALSQSLLELSLTSLYKYSIDTDAISMQSVPSLLQAVFDLSLLDGDIDTAAYLRPISADRDLKSCFVTLAAEVARFCAKNPSAAFQYILRAAGSITIYSQASENSGLRETRTHSDAAYRFKSYIGIGRDEDCLDWGRRATAVLAVPYALNARKMRVVIPGIIGLNRKKRNSQISSSSAIQNIIAISGGELPIFAFSLVDVSSGFGNRTYASIFVLLGLMEKLLSAKNAKDAHTVFARAYPELTVSGPDWLVSGGADISDEMDDDFDEKDKEHDKNSAIWDSIDKWIYDIKPCFINTMPSSILLGKIWVRLFFSLQKASEEIRPRESFGNIMEIFACCVINAFLIEEAEHHLHPDFNTNSITNIDRTNPRTAVDKFVKKLRNAALDRNTLPLTSIVATCPLILGLLGSQHGFEVALKPLFPDKTDESDIKNLLCPEKIREIMDNISIAGGKYTSPESQQKTRNAGRGNSV